MKTLANFDEEKHIYTHKESGERLPSVTGILKEMKYCGFYRGDGSAARRGTEIHKETEEHDTLGLDPVLCVHQEYVEQWAEYKRKSGIEILETEKLLVSEPFMYAGTMDRLVRFKDKIYILDIKTGSAASWHQYQLAAYAKALEDQEGITAEGGIVVYISKNKQGIITHSARMFTGVKWDHACRKWEQIITSYSKRKENVYRNNADE